MMKRTIPCLPCRPSRPVSSRATAHARLGLAALALASPALGAAAYATEAGPPSDIHVELGPITGVAPSKATVVVDSASRRQASWRDVQDGLEHNVRGLSLGELVAQVKPPKAADTAIFI